MIFISYRREDTQAEVTHLSQRLKSRFGAGNVFVDFNDIPPGERWPDTLRQNLEKSRILLAVVGPKWGEIRFTSGRNTNRLRLDDADDWVRQEICTALQRGDAMRVIVLTIDNACLPETSWDCELDELPNRQQLQIRNQRGFDDDFVRLCNWLEEQLPDLNDTFQPSANAKPDPQEALTRQELDRYLVSELRTQAYLQLPMISHQGHPIVAPISDLRIDLPLIVSHEHSLFEFLPSGTYHWRGTSIEYIHEQFRSSHTNALRVDRASRYEDIERDLTISQKLNPGNRLAIVGDPGCGKSTLLQWIAHHYGLQFQTRSVSDKPDTSLPAHDWLPLLILCRDLAGQPFPTQLDDLLRIHFRLRHFNESSIARLIPHVIDLLVQGKVILLIDGLDEIPESVQRVEFCKLLNSIANRFPDATLLITSRVVGFQSVQDELSTHFDHLLVGPLDRPAKRLFIERWARFIGWNPAKVNALTQQVCHSRVTAKLTDNIFLLAMIAQIRILDDSLPDRRVDVYRRAVQLMIQRRRSISGPSLSVNEVLPHIEFLAYWMRQEGIQRCSELDVRNAFDRLRDLEPDEPVLRMRSSGDLLRACIESLGLLTVAGVEVDRRGYDRQVIQFFHQSFQEYFAGQALIHEHGIMEREGAVVQLRNLLNSIEIQEREVDIWGNYKIRELVMADKWQETVRMAIADLKPNEANDAILMLLPTPNTPTHEARPRAVFALQCLAEEPRITHQTVSAVFDAMLDNLAEGDGFGTRINTWMDEALAAVAESASARFLHERLLDEYINSQGEQRMLVGSCLTLRFTVDTKVSAENVPELLNQARTGLRAAQPADRIQMALELMNRFYMSGGKLGFMSNAQQEEILALLLEAIDADPATASACIWALSWLTGAKNRKQYDGLDEFIWLTPQAIDRITSVVQQPETDVNMFSQGALLLTRDARFIPTTHQLDWIYELAVIADGGKPRRNLPKPNPTGRETTTDWLLNQLRITPDPKYGCRIAQALGAMGIFVPDMVAPLTFLFKNRKYADEERDEAMVYLSLIATPDVLDMLVEAADTPPTDDTDDYLYSRGLFALLHVDNVDLLAAQIVKDLPHSDLNAYAYGLAGSQDPRGRELLATLRNDPDQRIRTAAEKAVAQSNLWK